MMKNIELFAWCLKLQQLSLKTVSVIDIDFNLKIRFNIIFFFYNCNKLPCFIHPLRQKFYKKQDLKMLTNLSLVLTDLISSQNLLKTFKDFLEIYEDTSLLTLSKKCLKIFFALCRQAVSVLLFVRTLWHILCTIYYPW